MTYASTCATVPKASSMSATPPKRSITHEVLAAIKVEVGTRRGGHVVDAEIVVARDAAVGGAAGRIGGGDEQQSNEFKARRDVAAIMALRGAGPE
jgi:hypothetical protein